jgi:hypothetical protein
MGNGREATAAPGVSTIALYPGIAQEDTILRRVPPPFGPGGAADSTTGARERDFPPDEVRVAKAPVRIAPFDKAQGKAETVAERRARRPPAFAEPPADVLSRPLSTAARDSKIDDR